MEEKAVLGWLWYEEVLDWEDELDRREGDSSNETELAMGLCCLVNQSGGALGL